MMQSLPKWILCSAIASVLASAAHAASSTSAHSQAAIDRLKAENSGARVSISPATGTARFVRLGPGSALRLGAPAAATSASRSSALDAAARSFIDRHAGAFGLRSTASELKLSRTETDRQGDTHLTYVQQYAGLPVFGATLKAHFDAAGRLKVVNGLIVPNIDLSVAPSWSQSEAEASAVGFVKPKRGGGMLAARNTRLLVYREGLVKGVPGENRLAYEVVVGNGRNIREYVYVDAHTGKALDRFSGTPDALDRRAYDALGTTAPGPNYPGTPF